MTKQEKIEAARYWASQRKTKSGGRNGGRPRSADRCPCGLMTKKRARARGHRCTA